MSKTEFSSFEELHQAKNKALGIPEKHSEKLNQALPSIVQKNLELGLIKIRYDGTIISASKVKKTIVLGHIDKIEALKDYLSAHPEEVDWQ